MASLRENVQEAANKLTSGVQEKVTARAIARRSAILDKAVAAFQQRLGEAAAEPGVDPEEKLALQKEIDNIVEEALEQKEDYLDVLDAEKARQMALQEAEKAKQKADEQAAAAAASVEAAEQERRETAALFLGHLKVVAGLCKSKVERLLVHSRQSSLFPRWRRTYWLWSWRS